MEALEILKQIPLWIGLGGGVVGGILGMLPAVLNLIKQIRDLSSLVKVFISKYEKEMKTAGMESDFKQLVKEFDDVLEALAKILELFRMKSLANSLRDLEK